LPAAIHVARRLHEQRIAKLCRRRVRLVRFFPLQAGFVREKIDNHEADVVTRARVFRSGIAEAGDQANRFVFHKCETREAENRQSNAGAARTSDLLFAFFFFRSSGRSTLARRGWSALGWSRCAFSSFGCSLPSRGWRFFAPLLLSGV